ncbi:hypothetical protein OOU_Y34scaffold00589g12 [Pyricularia oryzae Y34]|uniref:Uncharacterized protein n=3 Tax=Pyricularia oryzae TaxID=318829 RepID=A0A4P7MXR8_PYROR|nr:hypothetical protein OOU_Y34scaffold00589g12 [Pyricularia oryzae Y34]QBZ54848.1 hypothetical protein PoMZ_10558 [Pyricularia oryzae]
MTSELRRSFFFSQRMFENWHGTVQTSCNGKHQPQTLTNGS